MKILYTVATGEIVMIGYFGSITPGSGQSVSEYDGDMPDNASFYTFDGGNLVRKNQEAIDELKAIAGFNVDLMTARFGQTFSGVAAVGLAPYLGAIQSYGAAKNFSGMNDFIGGLVALGKATQEQADQIIAIVEEQGIIL